MSAPQRARPQLSPDQMTRMIEQLRRDNKDLRVDVLRKDEQIDELNNEIEDLIESGLCGRDLTQTANLSLSDVKIQREVRDWIQDHFWHYHKHF